MTKLLLDVLDPKVDMMMHRYLMQIETALKEGKSGRTWKDVSGNDQHVFYHIRYMQNNESSSSQQGNITMRGEKILVRHVIN